MSVPRRKAANQVVAIAGHIERPGELCELRTTWSYGTGEFRTAQDRSESEDVQLPSGWYQVVHDNLNLLETCE